MGRWPVQRPPPDLLRVLSRWRRHLLFQRQSLLTGDADRLYATARGHRQSQLRALCLSYPQLQPGGGCANVNHAGFSGYERAHRVNYDQLHCIVHDLRGYHTQSERE